VQDATPPLRKGNLGIGEGLIGWIVWEFKAVGGDEKNCELEVKE